MDIMDVFGIFAVSAAPGTDSTIGAFEMG